MSVNAQLEFGTIPYSITWVYCTMHKPIYCMYKVYFTICEFCQSIVLSVNNCKSF
jgi:hypothetical protein